jgi:hypothetical protein
MEGKADNRADLRNLFALLFAKKKNVFLAFWSSLIACEQEKEGWKKLMELVMTIFLLWLCIVVCTVTP